MATQDVAFKQMEDFIRSTVEESLCDIPDIKAASLYALFSGGKRFRPRFLFALARACSVDFGNQLPDLIKLAAAIEIVHTYSLIHDDLPCMDNDDFRRGKPTVHKAFSESVALLTGDVLLGLSFEVLASSGFEKDFLAVFARKVGTAGMAAGQAYDLAFQAKAKAKDKVNRPSADEILKLHSLKTGALFELCGLGLGCLSFADGAFSDGASSDGVRDSRSLLGKIGLNYGLMFQVADDLLDEHDKDQDSINITRIWDRAEIKSWLHHMRSETRSLVEKLDGDPELLFALVDENIDRAL